MANKDYGKPVRGNCSELIEFSGNFAFNNAAVASVYAPGCTVAYSTTATFTVTIPGTFAKTAFVQAHCTMAGASKNTAMVKSVAQSGGNTVVTIIIVDSSTGLILGADIASGTDKACYFHFGFSNASATV